MSSPILERDQLSFPAFAPTNSRERHESDEDGTLLDDMDHSHLDQDDRHLKVTTSHATASDRNFRSRSPLSPMQQQDEAAQQRLEDNLVIYRAEQAAAASNAPKSNEDSMGRTRSAVGRSHTRADNESDHIDDFELNTGVIPGKPKVYKPPANPTTKFAKVIKKVHQSNVLVRYFCYIFPLGALLTIPIIFGRFLFPHANVGGVELMWFGVWLEIIWCTLWAGRVSCPVPNITLQLADSSDR
jgi:hypothetical protein